METERNENKFEILDKIRNNVLSTDVFNKEEVEILEKLSKDEDESVRYEVASILSYFSNENEEKVLIELTKDCDEMVRIEACDSLRYSKSNVTQKILIDIVNVDEDDLVRGYAIGSLTDIALEINNIDEIRKRLKIMLKREEEVFPKIKIFRGLYLFGEKKYLDLLLEFLDTEIYQNRCAVIHNLEELINDKNKVRIIKALNSRKKNEDSYAVTSTIDTFLKEYS